MVEKLKKVESPGPTIWASLYSAWVALTGNLYIAEMHFRVRLQHSSPSTGIQIIFVLPESISGEIHA